jgi:hypothetical protein
VFMKGSNCPGQLGTGDTVEFRRRTVFLFILVILRLFKQKCPHIKLISSN